MSQWLPVGSLAYTKRKRQLVYEQANGKDMGRLLDRKLRGSQNSYAANETIVSLCSEGAHPAGTIAYEVARFLYSGIFSETLTL